MGVGHGAAAYELDPLVGPPLSVEKISSVFAVIVAAASAAFAVLEAVVRLAVLEVLVVRIVDEGGHLYAFSAAPIFSSLKRANAVFTVKADFTGLYTA